MQRLKGAVVWRGASAFDGEEVVVIATSKPPSAANTKTGDVVQTWILREDMSPFQALETREEASVCGLCALRPQGPIGTQASRACYVHAGMVDNVWQAYRRGRYRDHSSTARPFAGRVVRLGSYGDPAAVPLEVWHRLLLGTRGHVGYTHAWLTCPEAFREIVMASCDTPEELREARRRGWRTFRTILPGEPLAEREISCPASAEAGKRTTCERCRLCDGSHRGFYDEDGVSSGRNDRRRDIAIVAHGWSAAVGAYRKMRGFLPVVQ